MSESPPEQPLSADDAAKARAASYLGRIISQRYRIDEVAAMGGMGAVYRGEHVRMHKRVAIKILHPDAEQLPELVRRFEREAIAGAHIQHPNVATATDFGEDEDGSFFLVLEFVRGRTLHELIRQGPMPATRAVHIARQIAAGLGAAHAMNIVHRDVKPRNVMVVEPQGDLVKVIDFGLAKVNVDGLRILASSPESQRTERSSYGERLTTAGTIFGTVAYLAPESAYGMEAVDARSDLYAVGLILYEMLAGKHPFLAVDPIELFNQQRSAKVPPIAEHAPGVEIAPALEAVVRRLLEKLPDARYENTAALIAALDEAAADAALPRKPVVIPDVGVRVVSTRAGSSPVLSVERWNEVRIDEPALVDDARPKAASSREPAPGPADAPAVAAADGGSSSGLAPGQAETADDDAAVEAVLVSEPVLVSSAPDPVGSTPSGTEPASPESIPASFGSRRAITPTSMQDLVEADAIERAAEREAEQQSADVAERAAPRAIRQSFAPQSARVSRIALFLGLGIIVIGAVVAIASRRRVPPHPGVATAVVNAPVLEPIVAPALNHAGGSPADSAVAPADSAVAPLAEPPADEAAREALVEAARAHLWVEAGDVLTALAERDPTALAERSVAMAARDVAVAIAKTGGDHADRVFDALANQFGANGIDVLYELVEVRGGSTSAERAAELLRKPEVAARGTAAVRIAFALRDCTCGEKMSLLDRALLEGDARTLVVLTTVVRPCFKKNHAVDEAIRSLRDRFPEP